MVCRTLSSLQLIVKFNVPAVAFAPFEYITIDMGIFVAYIKTFNLSCVI